MSLQWPWPPREFRPVQIFICVLLGVCVGGVTFLLHLFVYQLHLKAFMLPEGSHLSQQTFLDHPLLMFIVPVLGGLLLGQFRRKMNQIRSGDIVDPIEANAIYGGRMSVFDSIRLLISTLISNGSGISVGMEAAYTQIGACITSWAGHRLQLRREDMRILVAAGAGAAIAAAYNAPLAGAFYGFELVLGNYVVAALPQVTLAALSAVVFVRWLSGGEPIFQLEMPYTQISSGDYLIFALLGAVAGLLGILTMKAVTSCEHFFKRGFIPATLRPAVGGLLVGLLALNISPQVLGSGQGGIDSHLHWNHLWLLGPLLLLLAGKVAASAISIGSGFRGGLFSASLFLGCLLGQIAGIVVGHYLPQSSEQLQTLMLVGTGSVAASIVGAPVTMVMLVMEMTTSFDATTAVLAGVLVSSTVTRYAFGYSFATWRFHLRGLSISDASDIGWIKDITVEKLMLPPPKTAEADTPLLKLRVLYPAGAVQNIFLTDAQGRYKGVVSVAALHNPDLNANAAAMTAADIAKGKENFLLPRQTIKDALKVFSAARLEELPVLTSTRNHKLVGYAREVQFLKRYSQEFETHHLPQSAKAPSPP